MALVGVIGSCFGIMCRSVGIDDNLSTGPTCTFCIPCGILAISTYGALLALDQDPLASAWGENACRMCSFSAADIIVEDLDGLAFEVRPFGSAWLGLPVDWGAPEKFDLIGVDLDDDWLTGTVFDSCLLISSSTGET